MKKERESDFILRPLTESDFDTIIQWIDSPRLLFQYAGPQFSYPLTRDQLNEYIKDSSKKVYQLRDDKDRIIGKCELNIKSEEHIRLSRILIAPDQQGKGWGRLMVRKMIGKVNEYFPKATAIDLCVFSWNEPAIRCYQKVGFEIIPENTATFMAGEEEWERLNMRLKG